MPQNCDSQYANRADYNLHSQNLLFAFAGASYHASCKCAVSDLGRRLKVCKDWEEKNFTGVL